jgi:hypothetical protein
MSTPYTLGFVQKIVSSHRRIERAALVAVRRDNDFARCPLVIPGSGRRLLLNIREWAHRLTGAASRPNAQGQRGCMAPVRRQYRASTWRLSRFRSRLLPRSSVSTSDTLVVLMASCISGILLRLVSMT